MDPQHALKTGGLEESELLPFSHARAGRGKEVTKPAVLPSWLVNTFPIVGCALFNPL